jgi:PLP dependent protein
MIPDALPDTPLSRYLAVQANIAQTCKNSARAPDSVCLVAVSKTYDADVIRPLLTAGHRVFGENRVQESQGKWPGLREEFPGVELHLIGPLQSNKAKEAVALFDCIQTIDRPKIAQAVAAEMARQAKSIELFVQVNTGAEPQKAGILPNEAAAFVAYCRETLAISVAGLMCIPPVEEEPAVHFALLVNLAQDLGLSGLSMGMSGDYETAIQLGASHIRVGSSIFGARA